MPRDRRLTESVRVRLSAAQLAHVNAQAQEAGLTRSALLRRLLVGLEISTPDHHTQRRELIAQLARVGNNLNQLARVANTTGRIEVATELHEVLGQIRKILDELVPP